MPNLDVSDVLFDPDFMVKGIQLTRTSITVQNGRGVPTVENLTFDGVVTNNNGDKMNRMQDGTLIQASINIHTRFVLMEGDADHQADEIEWQGKTYIVSQVWSNTHFGRGFVKAICELKPLAG